MSSTVEQAINTRLDALDTFVQSNRIPSDHGADERNLAKMVLDMEIFDRTLASAPSATKSELQTLVESINERETNYYKC